MAGKKKKKAKRKIARARDPFWRLRRALGAGRVDSAKAYRRPTARSAAQKQIDDA